MKSLLPLIFLLCITSTLSISSRVLTSDFIDEINSKQTTWLAGRNFPEDMPLEDLHRLGSGTKGLHPDPNFKLRVVHHATRDVLPVSFDARQAWPYCESTKEIRSQGACASCWAFGAVSVMSDRLCIQSQGKQKFKFSPEELVSCCSNCGSCSGGYQGAAFEYWTQSGIVSGGDLDSNEGCLPYSATAATRGETPECRRSCTSSYRYSFQQDKHYGANNFYGLNGADGMAREIQSKGPIEAMYELFEDFYSYQSGVYQHVIGDSTGYHSVKIIGWGEEHGIPYWLVANSWGTGWGAEGGFFKILRGQNECGIEGGAIAGTPRI